MIVAAPQIWLGEPVRAFFSVVAADVWRGVPFIMLLLLAGLLGIPGRAVRGGVARRRESRCSNSAM